MLTVALAVLLGTFGARLFRRLKIPQVVAYIVMGVALGGMGLGLIDERTVEGLGPLSLLALGIIGFNIGGELRLDVFKQHGRSALVILIAEGMGAFVVVTLLTGLVTGNWALAIVLGAIASATAPAATVDVLWEYRSLGVLTTLVLVIVALDDGLALLLYGFASAIAKSILNHSAFSILTVLQPLYEIAGAALLGSAVALLFRYAQRRISDKEMVLALVLGSVMLLVGASEALRVDMILASMAFGALYTNIGGKESKEVFASIQRFAPPIFVLFFVLVGARLRLSVLGGILGLVALLYVIGRSGGKFLGVWLGARLSKAPPVVSRYLGLTLFSQAGVAIGLAILSGQVFAGHPEMASAIVAVITTSTFLVQIIGPPSVKFAIERAGEAGRNVTVEDLLAHFTVDQAMSKAPPVLRQDIPLAGVMSAVTRSDALHFPVVDADGKLTGVVTLEALKSVLTVPDIAPFIVAEDIMEPAGRSVQPGMKLSEAEELMRAQRRDFLTVVAADGSGRLLGMLPRRRIDKLLEDEIARRRGALPDSGVSA